MSDEIALALVQLFGRKGGEAGLSKERWEALNRWLSAVAFARDIGEDWMDAYYLYNLMGEG